MNDTTLTQLKIVVERAVRPVRASTFRKRKMREELLAHVSAVFEEEAARLGDERAALERTEQRFGTPTELTGQLQESVPALDYVFRFLENLFLRPGESTSRLAVRHAMLTFLVPGAILLLAFFIQGRMNEWPVIVAVPVLVFCFTFLADWMRRALYGPAGRSWRKAALVAVALWLLIPAVTFAVLLTYSSDVRSSLLDVLPLLPVGVLTPLIFAIPVHEFAGGIRSQQEWANLQIE